MSRKNSVQYFSTKCLLFWRISYCMSLHFLFALSICQQSQFRYCVFFHINFQTFGLQYHSEWNGKAHSPFNTKSRFFFFKVEWSRMKQWSMKYKFSSIFPQHKFQTKYLTKIYTYSSRSSSESEGDAPQNADILRII